MATNLNVKFLRGLQASLPTTGTDGYFYLATDTHRLYTSIDGKVVPVNEGVTTVANLDALTSVTGAQAGDFFYCTEENILAVYNGQTFVQINPDTGATSVEVVGEGNAVTAASYDATTRKLTLTRGETFATKDELDAVSEYVGTIPETAEATNIVAYIQEKTAGIATDTALEELTGRVATAEDEIDALQEASATHATKDELNAVDAKFANYKTAADQKAIDDEQDRRLGVIEGDYLKAADITNFETKENVKKVADDLDAYVESNDAALAAETKARTDADADFETRIAALEGNFGDGEGTVESQIAAAVKTEEDARKEAVAGVQGEVDAVEGRMDTAEGKITALEGASATHAIKTEVESALALKADKSVVDAMYTNTKIDELIQGAKDYADTNDADTKYGIAYDSENKKIKLVEGGTELEIDAADFIKDGMIETVTIGDDNDLVITFNTAAGKENIVLPLDQLVDIYTGVEGARVKVTVASDKSISADLVAGSISKNYLDADVQASLGKADTAIQDISHLATTEALNGVDAKFANYTNTTDMNAALDLKADKTQVATDIATAKSGAEAKAAELDAALKTELQAEIDADVKALADGQVKTNTEAIAAVENLLTWGEF